MTLTANKQLLAALLAIGGLLKVERTPGYCLKVVRQVEEKARGWRDGQFYDLIPNAPRTALGAELALKARGWEVPASDARPGDIVFNGRVSLPEGHVGRLVADGLVLENTTAARGVRLGGALALTPLAQFGVTTVIRLPESL